MPGPFSFEEETGLGLGLGLGPETGPGYRDGRAFPHRAEPESQPEPGFFESPAANDRSYAALVR